MNSTAVVYLCLERGDEARELYHNAYEAYRRALGEEHPDQRLGMRGGQYLMQRNTIIRKSEK
jgi:hypothetical protein